MDGYVREVVEEADLRLKTKQRDQAYLASSTISRTYPSILIFSYFCTKIECYSKEVVYVAPVHTQVAYFAVPFFNSTTVSSNTDSLTWDILISAT